MFMLTRLSFVKLINTFAFLALLFTSVNFFSVTGAPSVLAATDPKDAVCQGVKATGGSCDTPAPGETSINSTIKTIIRILSIIVGVVAVIMIIIGGFLYVTSGGDPQKTANAKNTLLFAVIGIVIVALAQVLVNFVINLVAPPPTP